MDDDYLLIGWVRELRDLSYFPSLHMNKEFKFTLKKLLFKFILMKHWNYVNVWSLKSPFLNSTSYRFRNAFPVWWELRTICEH